jgi:hypothetical protein
MVKYQARRNYGADTKAVSSTTGSDGCDKMKTWGNLSLRPGFPKKVPGFRDERIGRVLWNDPGAGVMRHADAGYEVAVECAEEQGLKLPMV